ncbi:hypothetical protein KAM644c_50540 (plasmid) [Klebsiella quasipneumoniae subsp. quasipneumoniae]|uniref:Uncharacterized protein n=1 Tax=Klebsiella quasipneumoniae subsp. quasipneumoniae TaxID=1667327 RepID=A0AAN1YAJ9_9ENTR|nr:hypothetical protein KAM622c_52190 [Klebsiella quasipneumoniae subsp. quasipneumoniae]BDO15988.1 hypothetical protein KAM644c_50540 [Klebsiella quasipneumoniae subsp. quasipneumoniae]BDO21964.1 hypothetical protein KAM645c_50540 [Klebsiella quasipneumoniae subsp. quasipneumoniae]
MIDTPCGEANEAFTAAQASVQDAYCSPVDVTMGTLAVLRLFAVIESKTFITDARSVA